MVIDVNQENNRKETPLMLSCKSKSINMVKYLIENGADENKGLKIENTFDYSNNNNNNSNNNNNNNNLWVEIKYILNNNNNNNKINNININNINNNDNNNEKYYIHLKKVKILNMSMKLI